MGVATSTGLCRMRHLSVEDRFMPNPSSHAEVRAERATKLPSFPLNLGDLKRSISQVLSTFGRNLIFHEYTTHDITHIDDMLSTLDWLIPEETRLIMSDGDW